MNIIPEPLEMLAKVTYSTGSAEAIRMSTLNQLYRTIVLNKEQLRSGRKCQSRN